MKLAILTPTYNRAHTLPRLFESLRKQTDSSFQWIVIDDGSTDRTPSLIREFISDGTVDIEYVRKTNGGKHTALNLGFGLVKSDIAVIVDSDDQLLANAVATMKATWARYDAHPRIGGIWFLMVDSSGSVIGQNFRRGEFVSNYVDELINRRVSGDKCVVYSTRALKSVRFPEFEGESFVAEGYLHKRIADVSDAVFVNQAIYLADYQPGGLSDSGRKLRLRNPRGMMTVSREFLTSNVTFRYRVKMLLRYQTFSLLSGVPARQLSRDPAPGLSLVVLPISLALSCIWRRQYSEILRSQASAGPTDQ